VPADWRRYWTRAPDLVSKERAAKRVILAGAVLLCGGIVLRVDITSATLGGWVLGVPLVFAWLCWASASALTQRGTGRLRVAWYALALLLAAALGIEPAVAGRWGFAAIVLGGAATVALATWAATRCLERTRARRIESGRVDHAGDGHA